jgi:hypothetical protein
MPKKIEAPEENPGTKKLIGVFTAPPPLCLGEVRTHGVPMKPAKLWRCLMALSVSIIMVQLHGFVLSFTSCPPFLGTSKGRVICDNQFPDRLVMTNKLRMQPYVDRRMTDGRHKGKSLSAGVFKCVYHLELVLGVM